MKKVEELKEVSGGVGSDTLKENVLEELDGTGKCWAKYEVGDRVELLNGLIGEIIFRCKETVYSDNEYINNKLCYKYHVRTDYPGYTVVVIADEIKRDSKNKV